MSKTGVPDIKTDIILFENITGLAPAVMLGGAAWDAVYSVKDYFGQKYLNEVYEYLDSEQMVGLIEEKTLAAFNADEQFRDKLQDGDPRNFYYSFLKELLVGNLLKKYPDVVEKLPVGFTEKALVVNTCCGISAS